MNQHLGDFLINIANVASFFIRTISLIIDMRTHWRQCEPVEQMLLDIN